MREVSVAAAVFSEEEVAPVEEAGVVRRVVCLFMYVSARVRAPARAVVEVVVSEEAVVVARRVEREDKRAVDIW